MFLSNDALKGQKNTYLIIDNDRFEIFFMILINNNSQLYCNLKKNTEEIIVT